MMRVGVVIATMGRPAELGQLLVHLADQSVPAAKIVISVTAPGDLPAQHAGDPTIVFGAAGLAAQRNRGLEAMLGSCDIVAFFDDDYLPTRDAIAGIAALFEAYPEVVGAHGLLLADGIASFGISYEDALVRLEGHRGNPDPARSVLVKQGGAYGCNMVFRASAIGALRFDEVLPLYGWQEDFDFASRLGAQGQIVHTDLFAGVHRGVKSGRGSGVRLGYSQIANPLYLARKGSMPFFYAMKLMAKNLIANHVLAVRPEPWVDRRGRVRGNWLAFADALTGELHPKRVIDLR